MRSTRSTPRSLRGLRRPTGRGLIKHVGVDLDAAELAALEAVLEAINIEGQRMSPGRKPFTRADWFRDCLRRSAKALGIPVPEGFPDPNRF